MKVYKHSAIILSVLLSLAVHLQAQRTSSPPVQSPVVNADRLVTFRLKAPNAKKVEVTTQFTKGNQPLSVDANGIWSVTLGPAEPNLYPYHFIVDGMSVADPNNPDIFPNERFKSSLIDIPGSEPSIHTVKDVPHGELAYCYYTSKTLGRTRPLVIYTPPGYRSGAERYPVLYLVSGTTDTEETWTKAGKANFILDNLLSEKRAVPMIIVMPYGNMMMGTPAPTSLQAAEMYKVFNDELVTDIMPLVEANYRVLPDRAKRAIAGFSRGGGQSLFTGFNNLDKFAWIGSYSAYLTPEVFEKYFTPLSAAPDTLNSKLKLLWLGVGKDDFLFEQAVEFDEFLKGKNIGHSSLITAGGHTWK
jgi:enterochelin esterase-like enzyme